MVKPITGVSTRSHRWAKYRWTDTSADAPKGPRARPHDCIGYALTTCLTPGARLSNPMRVYMWTHKLTTSSTGLGTAAGYLFWYGK